MSSHLSNGNICQPDKIAALPEFFKRIACQRVLSPDQCDSRVYLSMLSSPPLPLRVLLGQGFSKLSFYRAKKYQKMTWRRGVLLKGSNLLAGSTASEATFSELFYIRLP